MLVLRESERRRKRTEAPAHLLDWNGHGLRAVHPQIERCDLLAALDDRLGEPQLLVELKSARLHRQSARCVANLCRFIDKAHLDAQMREPQRQH
jgi:hypothetical protein